MAIKPLTVSTRIRFNKNVYDPLNGNLLAGIRERGTILEAKPEGWLVSVDWYPGTFVAKESDFERMGR